MWVSVIIVSPCLLAQEESQQLTHDKEELLGQVVSLQQQLETAKQECTRLTTKVTLSPTIAEG